MKILQTTVNSYKLARNDREEEKYNAGYAVRIRDYIASTYEVFPDFNWELLGPDVVYAIERIRKEIIVSVDKKRTTEEVHEKAEESPKAGATLDDGDAAETLDQEMEVEDGCSLMDPQAKTHSAEQGDVEIPQV